MRITIPVNNQGYRIITETDNGWKCELYHYKEKELVLVDDYEFWNFNIPQKWLNKNHVARLDEFLSEAQILNVLNDYINYVDDLRYSADQYTTHLYKDGKLIWKTNEHPKTTLVKHVIVNKPAYPNARAGMWKQEQPWLVGIKMNIKGIYMFDDLEARPVIDGKEICI